MMRPAVIPGEQHFILSSLPPSRAQKRLALAVVLALLVASPITDGMLSTIQFGRIDAFIPAYATAMLVNNSITAVLLFAQFSILRSRALLAIASGYLFTALIVIPWALTFPGILGPDGLLGAGLQSTSWLYTLWHGGFAMFVIAYALLEGSRSGQAVVAAFRGCGHPFERCADRSRRLRGNIYCHRWGCPIAPHQSRSGPFFHGVALYRQLSGPVQRSCGHCALDWAAFRARSMADGGDERVCHRDLYDRVSGPGPLQLRLVCRPGLRAPVGSLLLFVLLYEITILYAQVLRAVLAQRREREARLMTGDAVSASIAHEIKQPLSAMITNADAGLRWLDRTTPDLDEAMAAFKQIVHAGHRAGAVIDGIRAMFKKDARNRTALDINELIREALALAGDELRKHRVSVQAEPADQLPRVKGDRVQVQQVLLNLITNAINTMAAKDGSRVLRVRSEVHDGGGVIVSVADTGTRNRPARARADIQSPVHYKIRRYGNGSVDLPFDH